MVAHPETEWIWWLEEDAAFTDVEFKIPFHRTKITTSSFTAGRKKFTRRKAEGYWVFIVDTLKNITERYLEMETSAGMLRRRHAEKVSERYGVLREPLLKDAGHFAGCQPCNGIHNPVFSGEGCRDGMNKALNFADNQVLRNYGFVHRNLSDPSVVSPLPFDYPA
ncbi:hypothetical protein L1987_72745 [Smallanthus sonchifolius]|uniref:Uncharacterized protein n=1 Tax=Smallanthus sonchifolius TaxID=185202 RepID=A0ACB9AXR9_9ASTR|nr:hypothetical protein L1987_72745 [Smallanthus sonchifolius]